MTHYACCGFSFASWKEKENGWEKLPAVLGGRAATAPKLLQQFPTKLFSTLP